MLEKCKWSSLGFVFFVFFQGCYYLKLFWPFPERYYIVEEINVYRKSKVLSTAGQNINMIWVSWYEINGIVSDFGYYYTIKWNKCCLFYGFKGCITVDWCIFPNQTNCSCCSDVCLYYSYIHISTSDYLL